MNDVYHIYIKAKKEQGIKLSMQYDHNYAKENFKNYKVGPYHVLLRVLE